MLTPYKRKYFANDPFYPHNIFTLSLMPFYSVITMPYSSSKLLTSFLTLIFVFSMLVSDDFLRVHFSHLSFISFNACYRSYIVL